MSTDYIARSEFSKRINISQTRLNSHLPFTQNTKVTNDNKIVSRSGYICVFRRTIPTTCNIPTANMIHKHKTYKNEYKLQIERMKKLLQMQKRRKT